MKMIRFNIIQPPSITTRKFSKKFIYDHETNFVFYFHTPGAALIVNS